jgi:hypothetical protein
MGNQLVVYDIPPRDARKTEYKRVACIHGTPRCVSGFVKSSWRNYFESYGYTCLVCRTIEGSFPDRDCCCKGHDG